METKTAVRARFDAIHPQRLALRHRIHAHPEIGFAEEQAATWLCEVLAGALTIAQTAIGLLRQHMRATERVHGIITRGGDAPNIIPAHTTATYAVRAQPIEALADIRAKVMRCFEAGALATGASLHIVGERRPYAQLRHDAEIAVASRQNAAALGRIYPPAEPVPWGASTDMGNLSLALPAMHPTIGMDAFPAVNHQPEFTAHCITAAADRALVEGALAWTAVDLAPTPSLRNRLLQQQAR